MVDYFSLLCLLFFSIFASVLYLDACKLCSSLLLWNFSYDPVWMCSLFRIRLLQSKIVYVFFWMLKVSKLIRCYSYSIKLISVIAGSRTTERAGHWRMKCSTVSPSFPHIKQILSLPFFFIAALLVCRGYVPVINFNFTGILSTSLADLQLVLRRLWIPL